MNQENYNKEEVQEIIRDLDSVGLSPRLKISFSFEVNPNEFLYTNINKFVGSYWEKNSFSPETSVEHKMRSQITSPSSPDKNILTVWGPSEDVRKIQEDFPHFPWVSSETVEIISEEWT